MWLAFPVVARGIKVRLIFQFAQIYLAVTGILMKFSLVLAVIAVASTSAGRTVHASSSKNCPSACPAVYQPVCGSDGVTYSNKCFLNIADCNSNSGITQASMESVRVRRRLLLLETAKALTVLRAARGSTVLRAVPTV